MELFYAGVKVNIKKDFLLANSYSKDLMAKFYQKVYVKRSEGTLFPGFLRSFLTESARSKDFCHHVEVRVQLETFMTFLETFFHIFLHYFKVAGS